MSQDTRQIRQIRQIRQAGAAVALSLAAAGGLLGLPASRGLAAPGTGFFVAALVCLVVAGFSLQRVAALDRPRSVLRTSRRTGYC